METRRTIDNDVAAYIAEGCVKHLQSTLADSGYRFLQNRAKDSIQDLIYWALIAEVIKS